MKIKFLRNIGVDCLDELDNEVYSLSFFRDEVVDVDHCDRSVSNFFNIALTTGNTLLDVSEKDFQEIA